MPNSISKFLVIPIAGLLLIVVLAGCGRRPAAQSTTDTKPAPVVAETPATLPVAPEKSTPEVVSTKKPVPMRDPNKPVKIASIPVTATIPEELKPYDTSVTSFDRLLGGIFNTWFRLLNDGKTILSKGEKGECERWPLGIRADKPNERLVVPKSVVEVAPDGRMLVLADSVSNERNAKPWRMIGWDSKTRTQAWSIEFPEPYEGDYPRWSMSGDGRRVAVHWSGLVDSHGKLTSRPGIRVVIDMATGKVVKRRSSTAEKAELDEGLILSEDGQSAIAVVRSTAKGRERISRLVRWDIENDTDTPILVLEETDRPTANVQLLKVSRDGKWALLRYARFNLLVVDLETGSIRSRITTPHIGRAVFSPDMRYVGLGCAYGRASGLIIVVDLETGKEVLRRHPLGQAEALDFTADGRKLIWAGFEGCFFCEVPLPDGK